MKVKRSVEFTAKEKGELIEQALKVAAVESLGPLKDGEKIIVEDMSYSGAIVRIVSDTKDAPEEF